MLRTREELLRTKGEGKSKVLFRGSAKYGRIVMYSARFLNHVNKLRQ